MRLLMKAAVGYALGIILVCAMLFLPAGTLAYPGALLFLGLLFVPMFFLGIILAVKAPDLLAKRMNSKEKQSAQKGVVGASALIFIAGFVLAGLDFRFGWTSVPAWVTVCAAVIFLLSYGMYAEVMRENAYLSRTVEVQEGQKVIDTGLYGIVRHPMYSATVLLFLSLPIVLGSWIALLPFLTYPVIIAIRIRDEEKLLEEGLAGYKEYKKRVKYRLIPYIW